MDNAQLFGFFVVMGIATFITLTLTALAQVTGHSMLDGFGKSLPPMYGGFGVLDSES